MRVLGYSSRWAFVLNRCRGRTVLHLGCVGATDFPAEEKLQAFGAGRVLHPRLAAVSRELVGVDNDGPAVQLLRSRLGERTILIGDAEHLENLNLDRTFDIILCGDLLEHLSCPGRALEGARRFMATTSELIVSVPNSFALLANLRFTMGRFQDGAQHVATFSKFNLQTLLERHGFELKELYTAYDHPAFSRPERIKLALGVPFFRLLPERGGTLLAIAKMQS
jgi:SAM-dependent methyltransferase